MPDTKDNSDPATFSASRRTVVVRWILAVGVAVVVVVIAAVLPLPSVEQIRLWSESVGPAFPAVFFAVHAVVTIAPIPRTLFTVSAGVLFGPVVGIAVSVGATTLSAVLALLLVRTIGRDWVAARWRHPMIDVVDERLARRGWLAVGSLRLIAPVPFAVVNYSAALSSVRLTPFFFATLGGVIPGTVGIVLVGDALAGNANPVLLTISAVCIAVGVTGLVLDAKVPSRPREDSAPVPGDASPET